MGIYVYNEGMSEEEQTNGAYWERNMLALFFAIECNNQCEDNDCELNCGWYYHGEWKGWSRVISLYNGLATFHVPDDFDLGELPEIEPNWDGHSTEEKWKKIAKYCGVKNI